MNPNKHFIELLVDNNLLNITINDYPLITVVWNIFFLSIPFFLAKLFLNIWRKSKFKNFSDKITGFFVFFVWLIFVPNAAYVMTDVRHISGFCPHNFYRICIENAWMILFFFAYGLVGWIAYVYLMNQMGEMIDKILGKMWKNIYLSLMPPLISLGILLGLVDRWNSWDLIQNPLMIAKNALIYISDWTYFKNLLIYTFLLYILYFVGNFLFKKPKDLKW